MKKSPICLRNWPEDALSIGVLLYRKNMLVKFSKKGKASPPKSPLLAGSFSTSATIVPDHAAKSLLCKHAEVARQIHHVTNAVVVALLGRESRHPAQ